MTHRVNTNHMSTAHNKVKIV